MDIDEADHERLVQAARDRKMTLSNYIRQAVNLPLIRQGVKPEEPKKASRKKPRTK